MKNLEDFLSNFYFSQLFSIFFFQPHIDPSRPPRPFPNSYRDAWDEVHVRMPCSPHYLRNSRRQWDEMETALRRPLTTSLQLEVSTAHGHCFTSHSSLFLLSFSLFLAYFSVLIRDYLTDCFVFYNSTA